MSTGLPPIPLQQYAVDLSGAVARQDGGIAAAILNLQDRVAVERIYQGLPYATSRSFTDSPHLQEIKRIFVSSQLDGSGQTAWSLIASKHIAAVVHLAQAPPSADVSAAGQQHYQKAFDAQLDLSKTFLAWFQDTNQASTTWALPVLFCLCRDLKSLAINADNELRALGQRTAKLEEASRHITKAWTACLNDRSSNAFGGPRRNMGTYYLATLLFKIYFKLETLGLCKNIVRGIQNQSDLPPLDTFPRAHQVTYRYYIGVFAFLNEKYSDAERELEFAFNNCHRLAYRNQQRILSYLIPVKLLRGVLPSQRLFNNYPQLATLYAPLVHAYRIGDLKGYDDALAGTRAALISRGTFLIVERAREGCLRTLFKQVWLCSGKGSRLLVSTVQAALNHVNVNIDSDEVECLLANLIHKGHLRGYISHERQTVVLAKEKPFPDIIGKQLVV
ncbi:hypothetical protein P389DRAFT_22429 [Cystobasidium minutum MCA 4210]|uniref:uncharacterized protein n=1 Tax=Cystobasidium minutum MCA 4210 TaxID=1397322 RepID=UPI0034CE4654|eukprot:jgi/Rhomi1/22429/CE22428_291